MGLFDFLKNDKTENCAEFSIDKIIEELKKKTGKRAVKLVFNEKENVDIFKSKLGGKPCWNKSEEYPADSKGEKMPLLVQIALEEIPFETDLPKRGMLQFFISNGTDTECKVVYKSEFDFEEYDCEANAMPNDGFSPVLKECEISFEEAEDYICVNDNSFESELKEAVKSVTGQEMTGDMYDFFSEGDCEKLCKEFTGKGSKLFGNPCFVQCDPREEGSCETLLLQIDSDGRFTNWGDFGEGNFFINKNDLEKLNFSNILYSWDCN